MRGSDMTEGGSQQQQSHQHINMDSIRDWFTTATTYTRIDFLVSLLELCVSLEIRFLVACLEDFGRRKFTDYLENETRANDRNFLKEFPPLNEDNRCKFIVFLALLRSNNRACASELFDKIRHTPKGSSHNLVGDKYPRVMEEYILLYTMAAKHPAFSFFQRERLSDIARHLIVDKDGYDKISAVAAHHAAGSYSIRDQEHSSYPVRAAAAVTPTSSPSHKPSGGGSGNNTHQIQVTWSDKRVSHTKHTAEDFLNFHNKVVGMLDNNSTVLGNLTSAKNFGFHSQDAVNTYLKCLFSQSVPLAAHKSETFYKFFKPRPSSRSGGGRSNRSADSKSTTSNRDLRVSSSRDSSVGRSPNPPATHATDVPAKRAPSTQLVPYPIVQHYPSPAPRLELPVPQLNYTRLKSHHKDARKSNDIPDHDKMEDPHSYHPPHPPRPPVIFTAGSEGEDEEDENVFDHSESIYSHHHNLQNMVHTGGGFHPGIYAIPPSHMCLSPQSISRLPTTDDMTREETSGDASRNRISLKPSAMAGKPNSQGNPAIHGSGGHVAPPPPPPPELPNPGSHQAPAAPQVPISNQHNPQHSPQSRNMVIPHVMPSGGYSQLLPLSVAPQPTKDPESNVDQVSPRPLASDIVKGVASARNNPGSSQPAHTQHQPATQLQNSAPNFTSNATVMQLPPQAYMPATTQHGGGGFWIPHDGFFHYLDPRQARQFLSRDCHQQMVMVPPNYIRKQPGHMGQMYDKRYPVVRAAPARPQPYMGMPGHGHYASYPPKTCFNCGKEGHIADDCQEPTMEQLIRSDEYRINLDREEPPADDVHVNGELPVANGNLDSDPETGLEHE